MNDTEMIFWLLCGIVNWIMFWVMLIYSIRKDSFSLKSLLCNSEYDHMKLFSNSDTLEYVGLSFVLFLSGPIGLIIISIIVVVELSVMVSTVFFNPIVGRITYLLNASKKINIPLKKEGD